MTPQQPTETSGSRRGATAGIDGGDASAKWNKAARRALRLPAGGEVRGVTRELPADWCRGDEGEEIRSTCLCDGLIASAAGSVGDDALSPTTTTSTTAGGGTSPTSRGWLVSVVLAVRQID